MQPQICQLLTAQTPTVARFLQEQGFTDNASRLLSWLKLRNLISGDYATIAEQLQDYCFQYNRKCKQLMAKFECFGQKEIDAFDNFLELNPHLIMEGDYLLNDSVNSIGFELPMVVCKELFTSFVRSQFSDQNSEQIRKDVLRIFPYDKFFRKPSTMFAVFRLTKCLLQDFVDIDHCQGFDDFAGVCYQICYNCFQQNNIQHIHVLQELINQYDKLIVAEALAFVLYKEFYEIVKNQFEDLDTNEKNQWKEQQEKMLDPVKAQLLENELREQDFLHLNLTQTSYLIMRNVYHLNRQAYNILQRVEVPMELFFCRLIRTLFSRDMLSDQLAKIWDFVLTDETIFQNGFAIVGEIAALLLIYQLRNFKSNCDVLDVQEELFKVSRDNINPNLHQIIIYYLFVARQQTVYSFPLPVYFQDIKMQIQQKQMRNNSAPLVQSFPTETYKTNKTTQEHQGFLALQHLYQGDNHENSKFQKNIYQTQSRFFTSFSKTQKQSQENWTKQIMLQLQAASLIEQIQGALCSSDYDYLLDLAFKLAVIRQQMITDISDIYEPAIFPEINFERTYQEILFLVEELVIQVNDELSGSEYQQIIKDKFQQVFRK